MTLEKQDFIKRAWVTAAGTYCLWIFLGPLYVEYIPGAYTDNLIFTLYYHYPQHLIMIAVIIGAAIAKKSPEPFHRFLHFSAVSRESGAFAVKFFLVAYLTVVMLSVMMGNLFAKLEIEAPLQEGVMISFSEPMDMYIAQFVMAVIIAPVSEELTWRLVMYERLMLWFPKHRIFAMVVTSLAFSFVHLNFRAFIPLFVLAMFLQLAFLRTRSIYVPIAMHVVYNAINMLSILHLRLT